MNRRLRWHDYLTLNVYWLGLNISAGTITPVLLPYLVARFVPPEQKNSYLATARVAGLAVAMLVQPMAGLLSDRNTSRWGRRRPFILAGTLLDLLFLLLIGASPLFLGAPSDPLLQSTLGFNTAYGILLVGLVLLQFSSNLAQGATQGLIPDLVPEDHRGRVSGVKAVMELAPAFLAVFIGPLVDAGRTWVAVGVVMASLFLTMLITVLFVREEPLREPPSAPLAEPLLRLVALTAVFVGVTQGAIYLVRSSGTWLSRIRVGVGWQVAAVGVAGLTGMAGSILLGVYFGARVGIGPEARRRTSFIWWVINRLLFLAAVGSVEGFALYFLADALHIPNAATMTTVLLAAVGLFLLAFALLGGALSDRIGRKRPLLLAGLVSATGTFGLLLSSSFTHVLISGCVIGIGSGVFMATSWALGTDLVPPEAAGKYLGISNLAGAGAGIVGAGIGGPLADLFNGLQPGLGYRVIFAVYGVLFLLSSLTLSRVREDEGRS
ncbi:MAG TPA: MFS transporter [Chloroflexi bacterium]|nr:MFS transporter [Chloroflexota bacterium]